LTSVFGTDTDIATDLEPGSGEVTAGRLLERSTEAP